MQHQFSKPHWLIEIENVLEAMSEGIAVLEEGRVLYVNGAMLHMTGFQRPDMVGHHSTEFFAPEDLPFIQQQIARREREGHVRFEYYLLSRSGAKVPVIISSRTFHGPDQRQFAIVTCADIREQRRAAEELHAANAKLEKQHHDLLASEQRLASQSQALTELTAWEPGKAPAFHDRLRTILEISAGTLQVERLSVWRFENNRSVIRCLDLYERGPGRHSSGGLLRREDFPAYFEALVRERIIVANDAFRDPRTGEFGERYLTPAGIGAMLDAPLRQNDVLTGVLCAEHVGSARTWTFDEQNFTLSVANLIGVALANAQLKDSETRKDAMMQSALDCIITIDHQGNIIEFNPAAEKTFGYDRGQVIGKELATTIIPPSFREAHRLGMARYLATGEGPVLGRRIEITAMRSGGSEFPVELAIVPIHLGEKPIFTAYLRDITERKSAEQELHEAKEAAEAANHAKGELLVELRARHDELQATLQELKTIQNKLEAENSRKARELEEARRLQLAMLPKSIPKLPHIEIAVFMQTATEVGGDYYDFNVDAEGALTVAIGDATGHGLQAGTIVASTKSLFKALVDEPDPAQVLKKMSSALKSMGFRKMFMAMTVAKFDNHRLTLSAAGMPFTLVNRAATGNTEKVVLKAVPLGSFPNFDYQQKILKLQPGDTVLFVSDGLQETFNSQEEMLGENRVIRLFTEIANKRPDKIVAHLSKAAKSWARGRRQHDDMTILAMKMR